MKENVALNALKEIANLSNSKVWKQRYIDDYGDIARRAIAIMSDGTAEYCEWIINGEHLDPSCNRSMSIMRSPHGGTFCRYCGKPIRIKEPS